MTQQPEQKGPLFQILISANDRDNLVKLLNRVQTTGIEEAQVLINYAKGIRSAPVYIPAQPAKEAEKE